MVYGVPVPHPGEDELTVGAQDTMSGRNGDLAAQLRRLTEIVIDGQARNEARLDRVDARLERIEHDVSGLKTDIAETTAQLGRLELSTQHRFDRVDAEFESWGVYIKNEELKKNRLPPPRSGPQSPTRKRNPAGASGRESRTS